MQRILVAVLHAIRSFVRSRVDLAIENAALRQQLAILEKGKRRPRFQGSDRFFWVLLRHVWSGWAEVLIIVKPETVVRWHRKGSRTYWRWKSRRSGRPRPDREIRELIRRMATENSWGAPRIHAELLKLGFFVSERTVSRYMPKRQAGPDAVERWKSFLHNHRDVLAGMDFFSVPTATFRVLYVFFVIGHDRCRILHTNVTEHPTAEWIIQQLRETFPFDTAPRYLILDRDGKYGSVVPETLKTWGVKLVRIGWRSPWQNGVAERWVLSARRELLDHVVVFNEAHLRRLLAEYVRFYNIDRCHLALDKDAPEPRKPWPARRPLPRQSLCLVLVEFTTDTSGAISRALLPELTSDLDQAPFSLVWARGLPAPVEHATCRLGLSSPQSSGSSATHGRAHFPLTPCAEMSCSDAVDQFWRTTRLWARFTYDCRTRGHRQHHEPP